MELVLALIINLLLALSLRYQPAKSIVEVLRFFNSMNSFSVSLSLGRGRISLIIISLEKLIEDVAMVDEDVVVEVVGVVILMLAEVDPPEVVIGFGVIKFV